MENGSTSRFEKNKEMKSLPEIISAHYKGLLRKWAGTRSPFAKVPGTHVCAEYGTLD